MKDNLSDKSAKESKTSIFSKKPKKIVAANDNKEEDIYSFLRYLRINEIEVQVSYIHAKNSRLNVHNMFLQLNPFIIHGKFQT